MPFNMSPFKYFKSVSAGMHQNFDFLAGVESGGGGQGPGPLQNILNCYIFVFKYRKSNR